VVKISQDHVNFADHQLEHVELGLEQVKDGRFHRVGGDQVEDVNVILLPDAAEATYPLLDLHWIPGEIEVAQAVGELEVPAFAAGLGAKQDSRRAAKMIDCGCRPRPWARAILPE